MSMKKTFWEIFKVHPDGGIEPIKMVKIGGVQFGPGVRFGKGVSFSGVDLTLYIGHDLEVEEEGTLTIIKGIY